MPCSMSGDQDGSLSRSGSQIGSVQGGAAQPNLLGRSFSEFCSSITLSVREVRASATRLPGLLGRSFREFCSASLSVCAS